MTEDEMVEWPHQLDGHELEQALGVGDGQKSLACCNPMDSSPPGSSVHGISQASILEWFAIFSSRESS